MIYHTVHLGINIFCAVDIKMISLYCYKAGIYKGYAILGDRN